jgi:hypothetical protein
MHTSSSRAFQIHQEHDLKHPGTVDLITTKQNKLPSFIDRIKTKTLACKHLVTYFELVKFMHQLKTRKKKISLINYYCVLLCMLGGN